jgi:O-antigen/teichoic acid export membrane protein
MKRQLSFSKWLLSSSVLQFLNGNFLTLLVAVLVNASQVGFIKLAQNLTGLINPIYSFLDNHAQLYLAKVLSDHGYSMFKRKLFQIASVCLCGLSFILGAMYILKSQIINFLYGQQPEAVGLYLSIMLVLAFFTGVNFIVRLALKVLENTKMIFRGYLLSTVITICAIYPLINAFEGLGAVVAMVVSQVAMILAVLAFIGFSHRGNSIV